MKILIIYDSLFGNTEMIAHAIATGFDSKDVQLLKASATTPAHLKGADLIIVGSPTHGGRPSQPTQQFFNILGNGVLAGKQAAAFDTGIPMDGRGFMTRFFVRLFGYADRGIAKNLQKKGADVLDKQTFFVTEKEGPLREGELVRAKAWANELLVKAGVNPAQRDVS
jgi:flavodoxin